MECPNCGAWMHRETRTVTGLWGLHDEELWVCPECGYHFE